MVGRVVVFLVRSRFLFDKSSNCPLRCFNSPVSLSVGFRGAFRYGVVLVGSKVTVPPSVSLWLPSLGWWGVVKFPALADNDCVHTCRVKTFAHYVKQTEDLHELRLPISAVRVLQVALLSPLRFLVNGRVNQIQPADSL